MESPQDINVSSPTEPTHLELEQPIGGHFQYSPLVGEHDIRLLKLVERSSEADITKSRITGTLIHRSLDDLVKEPPTSGYLAISYTWGDPVPTNRLWLSDKEYLPITESAAYILQRVTCDEYLWIDSVCINQSDNNEKSIQLSYMWSIYKYAKKVLAWTGSAEDNGDLAMELLFDITFASLTEHMTGRTPVNLPASSVAYLPGVNTALWKNSRPPIPPSFHFESERWLALANFLDRPWWRRAWVIQEVVAAREVTIVMGSGQRQPDKVGIPWKAFNTHTSGYILQWENLTAVIKHLQVWGFLYWLDITGDGSPCDLPIYPAAIESIQRVEALKPARLDDRPNFQDNLLLTIGADAKDPRDKVFAIGSMSYGSLTEELVPNYEFSTEDVYVNATRHLLMRDRYLMTMHMAGIGWHRKIKSLPSWVPDYSTTRRTGTRQGEDFVLGKIAITALFASASSWLSNHRAQVQNLCSWRQLIQVKGIIIENIDVLCKGLSPARSIRKSMESENWIDRKVIHSWLSMVRSRICPNTLSKLYRNQNPTNPPDRILKLIPLESQALASALIVGSSHEGRAMGFTNPHTPLEMMYSTFETCVDQDIRPSQISASEAITHGLDAYLSALDRLPSWTVFRTKTGYIGRGPSLVRKGDLVCVFEGARTPFIIRKAAMHRFAPANFYHLVGECYVEGLMAKEANRMSSWKWGFITLW